MGAEHRPAGAPPPPINLLRGWPNTSLLPSSLLQHAANAVLSNAAIAHPALLYGPDEGDEQCREALAAWLTSFFQPSEAISVGRICVTGGASQNLGVTLGVYTDPEYTRNIWLVSPTYMLVFRIFEDAGFAAKLRAVPEDEQGIDIDYLHQEIRKSEEKAAKQGNSAPQFKPDRARAKVYKHVIYCVPSFSNPSSRTMTLQRRQELVRLAREFDALITCDDVYDFLQWPAELSDGQAEALKTTQLPRLVDVDRELDGGAERSGADGFGNVMSNGTFSKIAGPGLRTGWAEATPRFVYGLGQAGAQRSGGCPSHLTSTYLTQLLQSGHIQTHIQTVLCPAYASRYKTLMRAANEHLMPLGFVAPQPDRAVVGGYFTWFGLPETLHATTLATKCQTEENLILAPGQIFEVPTPGTPSSGASDSDSGSGGSGTYTFEHSIRLCFAWEDEWKLEEGIRRIAKVARQMLLTVRGDGSSSDGNHNHSSNHGDYVVVEKSDVAAEDMLQTFR